MKSITIENDTQDSLPAHNSSLFNYSAQAKGPVVRSKTAYKALFVKVQRPGSRPRTRIAPQKVFKPLTKDQTLHLQRLFEALYTVEKLLTIVPGLPPQDGGAKTIASSIKMSSLMARRAGLKHKTGHVTS